MPNDYGAAMENGIFYDLKETDTGLVGTPQAIDLNKIAAPPADREHHLMSPTITADHLAD
jgi:hypothetical protein